MPADRQLTGLLMPMTFKKHFLSQRSLEPMTKEFGWETIRKYQNAPLNVWQSSLNNCVSLWFDTLLKLFNTYVYENHILRLESGH